MQLSEMLEEVLPLAHPLKVEHVEKDEASREAARARFIFIWK